MEDFEENYHCPFKSRNLQSHGKHTSPASLNSPKKKHKKESLDSVQTLDSPKKKHKKESLDSVQTLDSLKKKHKKESLDSVQNESQSCAEYDYSSNQSFNKDLEVEKKLKRKNKSQTAIEFDSQTSDEIQSKYKENENISAESFSLSKHNSKKKKSKRKSEENLDTVTENFQNESRLLKTESQNLSSPKYSLPNTSNTLNQVEDLSNVNTKKRRGTSHQKNKNTTSNVINLDPENTINLHLQSCAEYDYSSNQSFNKDQEVEKKLKRKNKSQTAIEFDSQTSDEILLKYKENENISDESFSLSKHNSKKKKKKRKSEENLDPVTENFQYESSLLKTESQNLSSPKYSLPNTSNTLKQAEDLTNEESAEKTRGINRSFEALKNKNKLKLDESCKLKNECSVDLKEDAGNIISKSAKSPKSSGIVKNVLDSSLNTPLKSKKYFENSNETCPKSNEDIEDFTNKLLLKALKKVSIGTSNYFSNKDSEEKSIPKILLPDTSDLDKNRVQKLANPKRKLLKKVKTKDCGKEIPTPKITGEVSSSSSKSIDSAHSKIKKESVLHKNSSLEDLTKKLLSKALKNISSTPPSKKSLNNPPENQIKVPSEKHGKPSLNKTKKIGSKAKKQSEGKNIKIKKNSSIEDLRLQLLSIALRRLSPSTSKNVKETGMKNKNKVNKLCVDKNPITSLSLTDKPSNKTRTQKNQNKVRPRTKLNINSESDRLTKVVKKTKSDLLRKHSTNTLKKSNPSSPSKLKKNKKAGNQLDVLTSKLLADALAKVK